MMQKNILSSAAYELPASEYVGLVSVINQNTTLHHRERIKLPGDFQLSMIAVGSNGKMECHPQSRLELVGLVRPPVGNRIQNYARDQFTRLNHQGVHLESIRGNTFEIRTVNPESDVLSYADNNPDLVFPDRILHSTLIAGDQNLYHMARVKVLQEISHSPYASRIRRQIYNQLKLSRQSIRNGEYRGVRLFDDGCQFYSESQSLSTGIKIPLIRGVQRRLDLDLIDFLRTRKVDLHHIEPIYPSHTIERIRFLQHMRVYDSALAFKIESSYSWALREYHRAQDAYKQSDRHERISVNFSPEEFSYHQGVIYDFTFDRSRE